jgi:hypothetical protein
VLHTDELRQSISPAAADCHRYDRYNRREIGLVAIDQRQPTARFGRHIVDRPP